MKTRLLLLFLTFTVVLFGCKKDSPENKLADSKKQIIGTWEVQTTSITYYDASGKVVDTDDSNINKGETFQFVDGTTIKTSESPDDSYAYTLTNVNNKVMLNVANQSFEVKFSGNSAMSWSFEEPIDNDDSYAKAVTVIQFKKL